MSPIELLCTQELYTLMTRVPFRLGGKVSVGVEDKFTGGKVGSKPGAVSFTIRRSSVNDPFMLGFVVSFAISGSVIS